MFSSVAKFVIEELGVEKGEKLLKNAIGYFGEERGKKIANRIKSEGKPLTFKNWLIYTDIDSSNFRPIVGVENGDFIAKIKHCTFYNAAKEWGLEEYACIYCKYVDYKILDGYNPDVKLILNNLQTTGKNQCIFRYIMKKENK